MSNILYDAVSAFLNLVTSCYFKKITLVAKENVPRDGPVIICGNHSNQFVDPMLLIAHCPRPLGFCMAASSFNKPVIGSFAKKINVIPVYRPEDEQIKGHGLVKFTSDTVVTGINTSFVSEVAKMKLGLHAIAIEGISFLTQSVDSETQITIKYNKELYDKLLAKNPLVKEYRYKLVPKMDNSTMYIEAYKRLKDNKAVCIFPEGTSHDRTNFIQLKAGVALMALGAMAHHDTKEIKILCAGLSYFKRDQFRSEVIVEFGTPFTIPKEWGELFKTDKKQAIDLTLKEIELRMKAVTIQAPSLQELECMSLTREIYIPKNKTLPPAQVSELSKRISKAYDEIKDNKETKSLKRKIQRYKDELENVGLDDSEVKQMNYSYGYFVRKTFLSFILFHVYLIIALPMIAMTAPFLWLVKKKAEKERIAAKAKNPNKIQALDVVSSVKITHFAKFLPYIWIMWLAFFCFAVNWYLNEYTGFKVSNVVMGIIGTVIFPVLCYVTTRTVDRLFFYLDTMKTRFLFFCYPKKVYRLKDNRTRLEGEVIKFVNNYLKDNKELSSNRIIEPYGEAETLKGRSYVSAEMKKERDDKELQKFLEQNNLQ